MKNFKTKVLIGVFLALWIAISCNSSMSDTDQPATQVSVDTVIISGMAFHPANLNVSIGDTVVWINEDIVPHNATAFPGQEWTSGELKPGESWKKMISMSFDYYCSIHPTMKGKITLDN